MSEYFQSLQVRIGAPADRERILWGIRAAVDSPEIRRGSRLRNNPKLPAALLPDADRRFMIAPVDPGVKWIAVYDSEASDPGDQLVALGCALSAFLERPVVGFAVGTHSFYSTLMSDGANQTSVGRPLEGDADADEGLEGEPARWAELLDIDGDRLRELWDGESTEQSRMLAVADLLGMRRSRLQTSPRYLYFPAKSMTLQFIAEQRAVGVAPNSIPERWAEQTPREIDEPGFDVLHYLWTGSGWRVAG